jgi:hypothetical protein
MAVNAVEEVDAPQPQGRNDSVVSHLDAQAKAAERMAHTMLFPGLGGQIGTYAADSDEQQLTVGLGITGAIAHPEAEGHAFEGTQVVSSNRGESVQAPTGEEYRKLEQKRGHLPPSRRHSEREPGPDSPGCSTSPGPNRKKKRI